MLPEKYLTVLAAVCLLAVPVSAQPTFPYYLEGRAFLDGGPVPAGTLITAEDPEGTVCGLCNFTTSDETGWYVLVISGDDLSTPADEGPADGDTITFFIGEAQADQTLVWHPGDSDYDFNLTAPAPCDIETFGLYITTDRAGYLPGSTIHISGRLINSSCEPVAGATVPLIISNGTEAIFSEEKNTNTSGRFTLSYELANLSKGNYSATAFFENTTASISFVITECADQDADSFNLSNQYLDCGPADCNDTDPYINPGAEELCDYLDNNCDGQTDEGFNAGEACSAGTGACLSEGQYVCTPDGSGTECNAVPGPPSQETCDGIDNDCDGETDEGLNCGGKGGGGGVSGGSSGSAITYTPTCTEKWTCSEWSECTNGTQERSCQDENSCGTEKGKPSEARDCTLSEVAGETIICSAGAKLCVNSNLKECVNGTRWTLVKHCEAGCDGSKCKEASEEGPKQDVPVTGSFAFETAALYIGAIALVLIAAALFLLFRKRK